MITRSIERCKGYHAYENTFGDSNKASPYLPLRSINTTKQGQSLKPEEILRHGHITSIAETIQQLAQIASYAMEIFEDLHTETKQVESNFQLIHHRIDAIHRVLDDPKEFDALEKQFPDNTERLFAIPENCFNTKAQQLPARIQKIYDTCEPMPPLHLLNEFSKGPDSNCKLKYSYPGFFVEEWMKKEAFRQQKALEEKILRRKKRREQREGAATTTAASAAIGKKVTENKVKILNIRSWKDIYGTGEGKELRKPERAVISQQQQQQISETTSITLEASQKNDQEEEEDGQEGNFVNDMRSSASHVEVGSYQMDDVPPPPPPPPPTPANSASAIHGTSIEPRPMLPPQLANSIRRFRVEQEDEGFIPPPPPPPPIAYGGYVPPPPPPPSPPPAPTHQVKYDEEGEYEEIEWGASVPLPPPPPPTEPYPYYNEHDYPPPPPPPPPPPSLSVQPLSPVSSGRPPAFLAQIQTGANRLRKVEPQEFEEQKKKYTGVLSPRMDLLEQIKMKQNLRPTDKTLLQQPRPKAPVIHLDQPFANSIAKILERRAVIAYDSDSDEGKGSDDEW